MTASSWPFFMHDMDNRQAECVVLCRRILYNNVVSVFWNAFLSTLSHAPTIEPTGVMDFLNQQVTILSQLLHDVTFLSTSLQCWH